MTILIIVESPAKCKKIEDYLGYNYKCIASYGHLRTLENLKNIDYTNQLFPYSEFPNGLKIEFFDANEGSTVVSSDYGIVYYETKIVSLEGNVKILSPDGSSIFSSQIYWDPDEEWLFTEKNIVFSGEDYNIKASKLDADRSFKLLKTGQLNGNFLFEDN